MSKRKDIMLCNKFSLSRLESWGYPVIVQPKINGDRCRALLSIEPKTEGIRTRHPTTQLLSSQGNSRNFAVPDIVNQLNDLCVLLGDIELDGELWSPDLRHQEIRSITSRTKELHPDHSKIQYHIFDIFLEGIVQKDRIKYLANGLWEKWARLQNNNNIVIVGSHYVGDYTSLMEWYTNFLELGYEGIIIRKPDALYERKRSLNIMKLKPTEKTEYKIIGHTQEIDIHREPKSALGAVICVTESGSTFNVGTGPALTREARVRIWPKRRYIIGRTAVVKYQELSKKGIPIFPVLMEVV